jgi:hypothetical protein
MICGKDESPICVGFRLDKRWIALFFKPHGRTYQRFARGISNGAFDSGRVRLLRRKLLRGCQRARTAHQRASHHAEEHSPSIPGPSEGAPHPITPFHPQDQFRSPRAESSLLCMLPVILSPAIGPRNDSQGTSACGTPRPHVPSQLCEADSKDAERAILMDKKKLQASRSGFTRFWIR